MTQEQLIEIEKCKLQSNKQEQYKCLHQINAPTGNESPAFGLFLFLTPVLLVGIFMFYVMCKMTEFR